MLCFHIATRGQNRTEINSHRFYSLTKHSPESLVNRTVFQYRATGTDGIWNYTLHLNSAIKSEFILVAFPDGWKCTSPSLVKARNSLFAWYTLQLKHEILYGLQICQIRRYPDAFSCSIKQFKSGKQSHFPIWFHMGSLTCTNLILDAIDCRYTMITTLNTAFLVDSLPDLLSP